MKTNAMQIAMILDRSGSMSSIQGATVEGMNAFITEQQKSTAEVNLLLVQFDNVFEQLYSGPMTDAPTFTLSENPVGNQIRFLPRGGTALLDAMGKTMNTIGQTLSDLPEDQRPGKVVIVTMTDGMENQSREFSNQDIAEMIRHQRQVYRWEFQFLAANQDAISTAQRMNIPMANAITYAASTGGVRNVMAAVSSNVRDYGAARYPGAAMPAFKKEDRDAALEGEKP